MWHRYFKRAGTYIKLSSITILAYSNLIQFTKNQNYFELIIFANLPRVEEGYLNNGTANDSEIDSSFDLIF